MAVLGDAKNIIVGAAQVFVAEEGPLQYSQGSGSATVYNFAGTGATNGYPNAIASQKYADTVANSASASGAWRNVGYTMNGLEIQFQPDFGEVAVDQLLDVARMYKQGMQVSLVTAFAEATLENLLVATAGNSNDLQEGASLDVFNIQSGNLGEVPLERALVAIGPGSGDPAATGNNAIERIYIGLRALSIESVTVNAKRDEASMFEVTFRLMPASNGSYGKIVDRLVSYAGAI